MTTRRAALKYAAAGALSLVLPACGRDEKPAQSPFAGEALRLDLRHRVRDGADDFELVRARVEPASHGRKAARTGAPDWGDYRLSITDGSGALIFREGFDSSLDPRARDRKRVV